MHDQRLLEAIGRTGRSLSSVYQSELQFRQLLDKLPAGAYTCDCDGLITYFNQHAVHVWGREPSLNDPVDRFCGSFKLFAADGSPLKHEECWMALALRRGQEYNGCEIIVERPDGQRLTVLAHANPIRDGSGRVLGAANVLVDITDRKRAEEALRESDRAKDEFLALVGHELRNPLAAIVNGMEVLRRNEPGDQQERRLHELIDRQARHMQRLVEDLLDVSRIRRGKVTLRMERLDLAALLARVADDHRRFADEAGCTFHMQMPDAPLWIEGDATRVSQIVGNLLHNACKFTDAGESVTLSARADVEHALAVVTVSDTGVGMTAATLSRLFQPYSQSAVTLERSHGGLGLGLALVRGLTELHGGSVTAHSDGPGRGSEFTVRFPLAAARSVRPRRAPAGRDLRSSRSFRVLLVEDSRAVAEIFAMMLRELGHTVQVAASGDEALDQLRLIRPEVVFSDISMPGMNGYELAAHLRRDPTTDGVFLVAMTGYGQPEDRQRALEAGFDEHLVKPADLERLRDVFAAADQRLTALA